MKILLKIGANKDSKVVDDYKDNSGTKRQRGVLLLAHIYGKYQTERRIMKRNILKSSKLYLKPVPILMLIVT